MLGLRDSPDKMLQKFCCFYLCRWGPHVEVLKVPETLMVSVILRKNLPLICPPEIPYEDVISLRWRSIRWPDASALLDWYPVDDCRRAMLYFLAERQEIKGRQSSLQLYSFCAIYSTGLAVLYHSRQQHGLYRYRQMLFCLENI